MKWYEYFKHYAQMRYWWTQRDNKGVCWEIRYDHNRPGKFRLYRCDDYIATLDTLNEAMAMAEQA